MSKVGIIGAGTWGLALANLLDTNGHDVTVYARNSIQVVSLSKERKCDKLPGLYLSEKILFTNLIDEALEDKDAIIYALPSNAFREVVKSTIKKTKGTEYLITVTKGMEDKTLYTMSEIIEDELKKNKIKNNKIAALSGPTHAEEVAVAMPTMAVAASKSIKVAKFVQDLFMNENFRVYTNTDIKGVEVCAAFKNVIALATGVVDGLGYGDNVKAGLITRGLAEMVRVGKVLGCKKDTFYGLAGVGDMIVTATSLHSRNYRCGVLIGKGQKRDRAIKEIGMVVEGINFIPKAIRIKRKYKLDLPITSAMDDIVMKEKDPKEIALLLMKRKRKSE